MHTGTHRDIKGAEAFARICSHGCCMDFARIGVAPGERISSGER